MKQRTLFAVAVFATAFTIACSKSPAGPTSPQAGDGGGSTETDGTLKVSAPIAVSPADGAEVQELNPPLVIANSTPLYPADLPLSYVFEVLDAAGDVVHRSEPLEAGPDGHTWYRGGLHLRNDQVYSWRAYAVYAEQRGPTSSAASFKLFGSSRFGTVCRGSESEIVACRKAQYGHVPHDQLHELMEKIAYDLNVNGHEHRPYGRLVKTTGNNCHGYSCDIICSNANGQHRQWDVLMDEDSAQIPGWGRVGNVAVRPCEAAPDR